MLGWHISVYRQHPVSTQPAAASASEGPRVAVWQADVWGLRWLKDLVKEGEAIDLGGNGYPCRYTAPAKVIFPRILPQPPNENVIWQKDPWDIVDERWLGRTEIDHPAAEACSPDEWLLIEAWDES